MIPGLKERLTFTQLVNPGNQTGTPTSSALDTLGYEGDLVAIQQVGTRTLGTLTGKIQDSADGSSDWQDVTGYAFTAVAASSNLQTMRVDTRAVRRYVR